jgi:hypothetical protein
MASAAPVAARARTARRLTLALAAAAALGLGLGLWLGPRLGAPPRRLLVGVDDDTLKWTAYPLAVVRRQRALGADAVRVWIPWNGEARPGAIRRAELARAEAAARQTSVVLAVFGFGARTPARPAAQARFCGYAARALTLVPDARAVVVWNEANSRAYWRAGPATYERLLARCYDALHGARPRVAVLDSTASAHAPGAFLARVAAAYRASGRREPLVDAFGHNPYPRTSIEAPAATHTGGFVGEGDYGRLAATLARGFAGTAQDSHDIWYLEDGFQSTVPELLRRGYSGRETAVTATAAEQARRLRDAVLLAACQPTVRAFFNFELVDEARLAGWQSGLYWRGAAAKPAARAFAAAVRSVRGGCRHRP